MLVNKKVEKICANMFASYNMGIIRVFSWAAHKIFNIIYDKVVVDKNFLQTLSLYDAT